MKFVRDYIFECLRYSQESNMESNQNNNEITTPDARRRCQTLAVR